MRKITVVSQSGPRWLESVIIESGIKCQASIVESNKKIIASYSLTSISAPMYHNLIKKGRS